MGWAGICVFWLRTGQTDDGARAEELGGYWDADDEFIEISVLPPASEQIAARDRAVALLRDVEHARGGGPEGGEQLFFVDDWTEISMYDTSATVRVGVDRVAGSFAVMWRRVRLLASAAPSFVWDSDNDEVIDTSLTTDEAYDEYTWCD